jgi:hypothetical protein
VSWRAELRHGGDRELGALEPKLFEAVSQLVMQPLGVALAADGDLRAERGLADLVSMMPAWQRYASEGPKQVREASEIPD